jgi:hypothetical protein
VAIYTTLPFSHFPYLVPRILVVSTAAWEKAGRDWVRGFHPAQSWSQDFTSISME